MQIKSSWVKRKKKTLRRMVNKSKRGELPKANVDASYQASRQHALKGDNYRLVMSLDTYYKSLWEETT